TRWPPTGVPRASVCARWSGCRARREDCVVNPTADDALEARPFPEEEREVERPAHRRGAPRPSRAVLRRRRRARLAVFGVAAISAASMFVLVAFHVFAVQSAFQLDKLDRQLSVEQRRYGMLRDEVATRSSPEAVAR